MWCRTLSGTGYHCQNISFNLFSPCPAPFFLGKSRTFFFIISVFPGLCGMLSPDAKNETP